MWRAKVEQQHRWTDDNPWDDDLLDELWIDTHRARIDAGLDPGAGADDEPEDDIDMYQATQATCRFVDDEVSEAEEKETRMRSGKRIKRKASFAWNG